jgi:hypothetical protein
LVGRKAEARGRLEEVGRRCEVKKVLVALVVGLGLQAFAGVSLLASTIVIGGDKVYDYSLSGILDQPIRAAASALGEVCVLTEHFYYEGGLSYTRVLLFKSGLESGGGP